MSGSGAMTGMLTILPPRGWIRMVLILVRTVSCAAAVGTAMPGTAGRLTATTAGRAIAVAGLVCALSEVNRKQEPGSGPGEGLTADKRSVRGATPNKERGGDLHGLGVHNS